MEETLGQRIGRLREAAGLTQKQLAERAGVSVGNVRNWEQDIREPLASAVVKLASALGISTADILDAPTLAPDQPEKGARKPDEPLRRGRPKKERADEAGLGEGKKGASAEAPTPRRRTRKKGK